MAEHSNAKTVAGLALGGVTGFFLGRLSAKPKAPPEAEEVASRLVVEALWPDITYHLDNVFLLKYKHPPQEFDGYLYACMTLENNIDALFSVNIFRPPYEYMVNIEIVRLCVNELHVYFDDRLIVTFPVYEVGVPALGYYNWVIT